jgi:response regulator NasT
MTVVMLGVSRRSTLGLLLAVAVFAAAEGASISGALAARMAKGATLVEAADGEQAVELARSLRPDLVIMDVKMPKVDGIAAAAAIVEERIAPVVMLTAFSQRDLIERARDAGAMAYLVKPFQKRDLLPAIEMATSRFSEIRALEGEVTDLRERLEARKLIERAKGLLMSKHAMSEPEAFRWIQRAAMDNRTSMRSVAELVLSGDASG